MAQSNQNPTRVTVTGRFIGGGLWEPRKTTEDSAEKYSTCVVLNSGQASKVEKVVNAAIVEKWGNKKPSGLQIWGVREGDEEEFEASFEQEFINPKAGKPPQTLIKRGGVVEKVTEEEDILYPGCYVAVSIGAYAYDGDKKKSIKPGVSLNVRAIMFTKDGERLGDVVNAEAEFEDFESAETDEEDLF